MTLVARVCGVIFILALASLSPASWYVYGCYVSCPDGFYFIQASQCCGQIPRYEFTCPDGSDAYGYGYEDENGPHFCGSAAVLSKPEGVTFE